MDVRTESTLHKESEVSAEFALLQQEREALLRSIDAAQGNVKGVTKFLPFLGKNAKAEIANKSAEVEALDKKLEKVKAQRQELHELLNTFAERALQKRKDPGLEKSVQGKGFFRSIRVRLENFRETTAKFLKALGEARGAMSVNYDRANQKYSEQAVEQMKAAVAAAKKVDAEISQLEKIGEEFRATAKDTPFQRIVLPQLGAPNYAKALSQASQKPIGEAHGVFENILKECENLRDEGIDEAIEELESAEGDHEALYQEFLAEEWRTWHSRPSPVSAT